MQGACVRSLVRKLSSHMACSQKKKNIYIYIYIYIYKRGTLDSEKLLPHSQKVEKLDSNQSYLTPKPTFLTYKIDILLLKTAIYWWSMCQTVYEHSQISSSKPSGMSGSLFYRGGAESLRGKVTCPKLLSSKEVT